MSLISMAFVTDGICGIHSQSFCHVASPIVTYTLLLLKGYPAIFNAFPLQNYVRPSARMNQHSLIEYSRERCLLRGARRCHKEIAIEVWKSHRPPARRVFKKRDFSSSRIVATTNRSGVYGRIDDIPLGVEIQGQSLECGANKKLVDRRRRRVRHVPSLPPLE